jgi:hypothetical protein
LHVWRQVHDRQVCAAVVANPFGAGLGQHAVGRSDDLLVQGAEAVAFGAAAGAE